MRITCELIDDQVSVKLESAAAEDKVYNYVDILSVLLNSLSTVTKEYKEANELDNIQEEQLYDALDASFGAFLKHTFPDVEVGEFDLSDAAIVYAQDAIINEAYKEDITFEEALERYENKAREYIDARNRKMS